LKNIFSLNILYIKYFLIMIIKEKVVVRYEENNKEKTMMARW
jgi:hypothetical protein